MVISEIFVAKENLAELLGFPNEKPQYISIIFDPFKGLEVSFDGKVQFLYEESSGLKISTDGKIILPDKGRCGGGEGGLFGCYNYTVSLYINGGGNLVAQQSGGGAGLFLVVPVGIYANHLSIYTRKQ